jgi:hypothetical protein
MATRFHKSPVLSSLIARLKDAGAARARKPKIAFPEYAMDPRVRQACAELEAEGDFEIVTTFDNLDTANQQLAAKTVNGVVSGAVYSSGDVIRSGIKNVGLRDGIKALSSFFIMELPDQQSFIYSDCAVQVRESLTPSHTNEDVINCKRAGERLESLTLPHTHEEVIDCCRAAGPYRRAARRDRHPVGRELQASPRQGAYDNINNNNMCII